MQSIGELFVNLGFEVDDSKLKGFTDGIKGLSSDMLKFAGISSISVAGLAYFMSGSANAATAMKNFNIQTGESIEGLQRFISAVRQTNPAETFESGLAAAKNLNQYLTEARMGQRSMLELNMLGFTPEGIPTFDEVIEGVRKGLLNNKYDVNLQRQWLQAVFGTAGIKPALDLPTAEYQKMGAKGIASAENLEALHQYNRELSSIGVSWDSLKMQITGTAAPSIISALNAMTEAAQGFAHASQPQQKYGTFSEWLENEGWGGILWQSFVEGLPMLGAGAANVGAITTIGAKNIFGGKGASDDLTRAFLEYNGLADNTAPQDIVNPVTYLQKKGWSRAQASGMVARLIKESGMNPEAVGDGGRAYGIAQWHPNRQEDFREFAGKDIREATMREQLDFVNYELTRGKERRAGEALRQTSTTTAAEGIMTKMYERPAATINMYITGDNPQEIGEEVMRQLERENSSAYSQRNLGAAY